MNDSVDVGGARRVVGVVPPVCTPLTPEYEIDIPSLARLVEYLLDGGVEGLFLMGSTSEVAYLPDGHRCTVIEAVTSQVANQVPVLAGAIDTTTLRVLDHAEAAVKIGVSGIVATAPFYTRTHPVEIERHFSLLAHRLDVPIYAYDVPVSVHSKLDHQMVLDLAADGVLRGLKDSSGDAEGLRKLLVARRDRNIDNFSVLTGSELIVDSALFMGADGVIPGLGNVDPSGYSRLYQSCRQGAWGEARSEQDRLLRLFRIVEAGDPARMGSNAAALGAFKAALYLLGIIDCPVTAPPQTQLDEQEVARIRELLIATGLHPAR